ncbi:MAG: prenyltransferase/squalene oxidase repeat-containing protein [Planctomycetota bacterium]
MPRVDPALHDDSQAGIPPGPPPLPTTAATPINADAVLAPAPPPPPTPPATRDSTSEQPGSAEQRPEPPLPPMVSPLDLIASAPPWLVSAAAHMLLMIVLGLLFVAAEVQPELLLRFDYQDAFDETLGESLDLDVDFDQAPLDDAPLISDEILESATVTDFATEVEEPVTPAVDALTVEPIRMALSGREAGMRDALLKAYGGTAATQRAVRDGLAWLVRNRRSDGMWDMNGKFDDGIEPSNPDAATGMALIAFQGAGYTPDGDPEEPFTKVVRRAWRGLLKRQREDGSFFNTGRSHGQLYTHAICTIAVCELYGMTGDSRYRDAAQRAIDFCVSAQSDEGGWRYYPGTGSDLSVTGWFVMALQSARMAGLDVPTTTLDAVSEYLDTVSSDYGSRYSYRKGQAATFAMTAEGLLCRQYLGWGHDDERLVQGATLLTEELPSWSKRNVYYWYYASQVCHHMEGEIWRTWNETMRRVIPDNQVRTGKERGSWDPDGDRWGNAGGRLFVTCLSIYNLEVYYRHLPIYQLELAR